MPKSAAPAPENAYTCGPAHPPLSPPAMQPISDTDALFLLATTLASKRRPAELVEIIAGFEPLLEPVPGTSRLIDSIRRLTAHGLVQVEDERFSLSAAGQQLMVGLPRKADTAGLVTHLRGKLAAFEGPASFPSVHLGQAQVDRAVLTQRAAAKEPGKNLLMPKPKAEEEDTRRSSWRGGGKGRR